MIKRIELINFMSHPHTVIFPAEGLTVLTGDNNTGKSAVIAALQILSRNTSGDFMVRHGARECRIIVETDEGHVLEWKRKNNTVSYTINGREVHRLRGSVPDDLHDLLRMPPVEAEGGTFDIHFGEQKKPIFLLDESPARRATFFASASDTIKLIEMQNRHRQKVRDAKMAEKRLEKEKSDLNRRLDALAPLETLDRQLQNLETEHAAIQSMNARIDKLARLHRQMGQTKSRVSRWMETAAGTAALTAPPALAPTDFLTHTIKRISQLTTLTRKSLEQTGMLAGLAAPPALSDTRRLSDLIERINQAEVRKRQFENRATSLSRLSLPPEMPDTKKLDELITRMQALNRGIERDSEAVSRLSRCQAPPEISSPEALKAIINRLKAAESDVLAKKNRVLLLEELSPPPLSADTQRLETLIRQIQDSKKTRDRLAKEKNRIEKAAGQAETRLRQWIEQTGVCPTCGRQMDPDQFMSHAFNTVQAADE